MFIKDAIELLHAGFTVDEIKAMDKDKQEEPAADETLAEKTPQKDAQPSDNDTTAAHKTVDEAQQSTDDLNKEIEDLKAQLKAAQDLNNKQGVLADTSKEETAEDILKDFINNL